MYYDDMRAAVRRRGASAGLDEEVVHDLYLQLSKRPDSVVGKRSLRSFLVRAAVNLCIDRARRAALEARIFEALDADVHGARMAAAPADLHLDIERKLAVLQRAIFELPPQCRIVFVAYRVGGMGKDEIAAHLGIKRGMVNRHLRKAMLHCMDRLDAYDSQ